ncbi:glycoside-pentoside-hexuronide (GPH):cation symporter [Enterococcus canintestini]|uniref:glycoside-pentoside-hexuronide (GPH):cation symporter n=1 Tax=Enterococcus canintestini TaxID=317010 RepID=UPI0037BF201A
MESTKGMKHDVRGISKWRQRLGYGISDLACNLIWQMISLYLLYFYTDIMGLNAAAVSLMFVITRIIDGVTDLLVGYLIDHTHTRWGKSRPYFLFGAIPFAFFAFLCFSVPNTSVAGKMVYAYVTYIGLSFSYTLVNVPMASILPSLTTDAKERTALSTSRKFFGFLGATVVSFSALVLVNLFGGNNQALGFKKVMFMFGLIGCILFFITFLSVREIRVEEKQTLTMKNIIKALRQNTPWLIFALNILFMWTGFFLLTSSLVYYFVVVVGDRGLSITIATIMSVVPMCANFFVPFLANKMGKRNLFIIASLIQAGGIVIILLGTINHFIIIVGALVSALGYGIKESIYFSMQADPVDYGIWKNGIDVSGSLSAINGFLGKVAQAVAGGIAGILLAWGSYAPNAVEQTNQATLAIKLMYGYIPIALIVGSVIVMSFYKLDQEYPQIQVELAQRRKI